MAFYRNWPVCIPDEIEGGELVVMVDFFHYPEVVGRRLYNPVYAYIDVVKCTYKDQAYSLTEYQENQVEHILLERVNKHLDNLTAA